LKFGYCIENYDVYLTSDNLIRTARLLDESNFHSLWTTDHILMPKGTRLPVYENISEAITTLAFLAGYTKNIKLGVSTLVLPLRNPILVAKQLASLDFLSKGRLVSSFGVGWADREYGFLQKKFKDRGKRIDHDLELIKALWGGAPSFKGHEFSYSDASFSPITEKINDSLFLIAGNSKFALERSIKYGNGWHPVWHVPPEGISGEDITKGLQSFSDIIQDNNVKIWFRIMHTGDIFEEITKEFGNHNISGLIWDISRGDSSTYQSRKEKLVDFVRNY
jgi:alkanesulfonate monooxygenase SsuD/methylene tetrahydromethanopterin reductase-like flavin-dependent oxidoreductase (luciferase family)